MESCFIQTGDIRTHYLQAGTGDPLILIHGFPETSHEWRKVFPALAEKYAVFAPDTRGHGRTDKPKDGYTRANLAQDIVNFMDALGMEKAAVAGHDWGGIIACKLALDWGHRVSRLALLDTICTGWPVFVDYYYWFMAEPLPEQFFPARAKQFIETLFTGQSDPPLPGPPATPWNMPREFIMPTPWITREDLDAYIEPMKDPDEAAATIAYYRCLDFHRIIADKSAPNGERYEPVSHEEMARKWHAQALHTEYLDYGVEDRHKHYLGPVLWMFGSYLIAASGGSLEPGECPGGDPAWESFPRHFPNIQPAPVDAGHFFAEEAPEAVQAELLRFLAG